MESQDTIFLQARQIADLAERAAYLTQACGNDADLRQRVEAMVRDATGADEFFGSEVTVVSGASVTEGPGTVMGGRMVGAFVTGASAARLAVA